MARKKREKTRRSKRRRVSNAPAFTLFKKKRKRRQRPTARKATRRRARRYGNPPPLKLAQNIGGAILAGTVGMAVSRAVATALEKMVPYNVPQRDLIVQGLGAAVVVAAAEYAVPRQSNIRYSIPVGASAPFTWALLGKTPLAGILGLPYSPMMMQLPALPEKSGVSAELGAALEAQLEYEGEEDFVSSY